MPPPADPEEDYASSEDSDFAPDDGAEAESSPSDDDNDEPEQRDYSNETRPAKGARKRAAPDQEAEDAGFENSGDEAVIDKAKKKSRKSRKRRKPAAAAVAGAGHDADDNDEGGEDGLIKTRSMRAQEKSERKYATTSGPVTIDVDALWAEMMGLGPASGAAKPTGGVASTIGDSAVPSLDTQANTEDQARPAEGEGAAAGSQRQDEPSEMIRIRRTYNFAGKVHGEEKLVPRDSAEAKLYLASLGDEAGGNPEGQGAPRRMPRRAFRSIFEPVTDQQLQQRRADLNLGLGARLRARELAGGAEARKLNTVEKSRMDWAGYVDKAGIKDELELAGKSKDSFAARQDFLARSEAVREEEARRARLAGRV